MGSSVAQQHHQQLHMQLQAMLLMRHLRLLQHPQATTPTLLTQPQVLCIESN